MFLQKFHLGDPFIQTPDILPHHIRDTLWFPLENPHLVKIRIIKGLQPVKLFPLCGISFSSLLPLGKFGL